MTPERLLYLIDDYTFRCNDMLCRRITKRHRWPKRRTCPWIRSTHDRCCRITRRIQALYWLIIF